MHDAWFATDKLKHVMVCAGVAGSVALILPAWVGVSCALLIGALKESLDWLSRQGSPSWRDMAANVAGALAGVTMVRVVGF